MIYWQDWNIHVVSKPKLTIILGKIYYAKKKKKKKKIVNIQPYGPSRPMSFVTLFIFNWNIIFRSSILSILCLLGYEHLNSVLNKWATSWENLLLPYANNKGADQPVHPRSLISAFVVRCLDSIIPPVCISEISSLYLTTVAEQAGLSLSWSQTPETGFLVTRLVNDNYHELVPTSMQVLWWLYRVLNSQSHVIMFYMHRLAKILSEGFAMQQMPFNLFKKY